MPPLRSTEGSTPPAAMPHSLDSLTPGQSGTAQHATSNRNLLGQVGESATPSARSPQADPRSALTQAPTGTTFTAPETQYRFNAVQNNQQVAPKAYAQNADVRLSPGTFERNTTPATTVAQDDPQTRETQLISAIHTSSRQFAGLLSSGDLDTQIEQAFNINEMLQTLNTTLASKTDNERTTSLAEISEQLDQLQIVGPGQEDLNQIKQLLSDAASPSPKASLQTAPSQSSAAGELDTRALDFTDVLAEVLHQVTQANNEIRDAVRSINRDIPIFLSQDAKLPEIKQNSIRETLQQAGTMLRSAYAAADHAQSGSWSKADSTQFITELLTDAREVLNPIATQYAAITESVDNAISMIKLASVTAESRPSPRQWV